MMAGMDRYYQIVKCFRDEDFRADRQPEFSQIDCEMSFVEREDVLQTFETVMQDIIEGFSGNRPEKFTRMSYQDAMERYGSDKPDLRYELLIQDISTLVKDCNFKVFADAAANGGIVNALVLKGAAEKYSRKVIDELTEKDAFSKKVYESYRSFQKEINYWSTKTEQPFYNTLMH